MKWIFDVIDEVFVQTHLVDIYHTEEEIYESAQLSSMSDRTIQETDTENINTPLGKLVL
jgi:hypothetical protein